MRDRGKCWNRKRWVSICSMHYEYRKDCTICNAGNWRNVWNMNISRIVCKIAPRFWRWYMN